MQLAINGGSPVKEHSGDYMKWPICTEQDKTNLLDVLHSGVWGLNGKAKEKLTQRYTDWSRTRFGLAVINGTAGLELILRGLGIGRGDEVIVPPYTFAATISAIIMCGAVPVFADIEPDSFLLDAGDVEHRITFKTRAVITVHLAGRICDFDRLDALCKKKGLALVEDAAQAHGSAWNGKPAGGLGAAGSFSFQATKNLACGEGGFITTNDEALYHRIWGICHNGRAFGDNSYNHPVLGTNCRMSEWQAAILNSQIERVEEQLDLRMKNAAYLDSQLAEFPFLEPVRIYPANNRISYHMYMLRYRAEALDGLTRERFLRALEAENVCNAGDGYSLPVYDMEMMTGEDYRRYTGEKFSSPKDNLPHNETAARKTGIWLTQTSLLGSRRDMDAIVEAVGKIYANKDELAANHMARERG